MKLRRAVLGTLDGAGHGAVAGAVELRPHFAAVEGLQQVH
jgi:hypothetical protein